MKVIGRTDAHVVDLLPLTLEFVEMTVEALELHKEIGIGEVAVHYANAIELIQRSQKVITRLLNCP